jgi:hypothetical protein
MVFIFLEFYFEEFFLGGASPRSAAVSKNRPKYPMLDIPFAAKKNHIWWLKLPLL